MRGDVNDRPVYPTEAAKHALATARLSGCDCDPDITITDEDGVAFAPDIDLRGVVSLAAVRHDDYCTLWRSIEGG